MSYRGVTADPPDSGPAVYSARRALPLEAIGSVDRDDEHAMYALRLGCHAGQTAAFVAADFTPPPSWEDGEFPEPPLGELVRAPRVAPAGSPGTFRGVLVSKADLLIEVGDIRVYSDRIRFVISILPVTSPSGRTTTRAGLSSRACTAARMTRRSSATTTAGSPSDTCGTSASGRSSEPPPSAPATRRRSSRPRLDRATP
jgi:hypothetical protein